MSVMDYSNLLKVIIFTFLSFISFNGYSEDKSEKIAGFIQSKVNYCTCHSSSESIVHCDIKLPIGTDINQATAAVEKVANTFAQLGRAASTIFYTGYVGAQKVCKFKYDMYSGTVSKEF